MHVDTTYSGTNSRQGRLKAIALAGGPTVLEERGSGDRALDEGTDF